MWSNFPTLVLGPYLPGLYRPRPRTGDPYAFGLASLPRSQPISLPSRLSSALKATPITLAASDGMGTPPMATSLLALTVKPNIGPTGVSLGLAGLGSVKMQCVVTSTASRAARAPSIQTFDDPSLIS